ncbi:MAG: trigger factor [Muribaculaceae bacterium]|nr:trigger factor [Muribaculaceae bacterium]
MNVTFEKIDDVNGIVTVELAAADYADNVKKALKNIAKNRPEPGFRPGKTPTALIQKKYGEAVKYDEVNKATSEAIYNYIKENNLRVLGNPVPEADEKFDIKNDDFTFKFKVGLAPEIESPVNKDMKVPYYNIEVTDEMITTQDQNLRRRFGKQESGDTVESNAVVKGIITELNEDGSVKEGGIVVENGIVGPEHFKSEEQKALFVGKKVGDKFTFNPSATCDGNPVELSSMLHIDKDDVENHKGDFQFEVTDSIVLRPAELGQEYYDQLFGKDNVKNEEEYRKSVKDMIEAQLGNDSDFRFTIDSKDAILKAVGDIVLPDAVLKDYLKQANETLNDENIDAEYASARPQLVWQLVSDKIAQALDVKVEREDVLELAKAIARNQFAQYGMPSVPDDILEKYAQEIVNGKQGDQVRQQAFESKLFSAIKDAVTLEEKNVSVEDFNKLFAPAEA